MSETTAAAVERTSPGSAPAKRRWWQTWRGAIAGLLVLQVLLALVALAVWVWTPNAPALPPRPAERAPLIGDGATYESALPLARKQAAAWLPGALLLNASMQVDWPWTVPPGEPAEIPGTGWLTYAFVAPWHPPGRPPGAASLGVVIERLSGEVVSQDTRGWEEPPAWPEPIPPSSIDSSTAILLAEAAGGTDFRRACPNFRHLSRTFPVAAKRTEWPQHWVISYEDTRAPEKHGLLFRIDAETGEVLDRRVTAPNCETPP